MFQLAFGLGTDTWEPGIVGNALRWLCSLLDTVVYQLIVLVYQVLFTIADSSILSSEFIKDFYERFQLIIGVFMIFKLSISVLQAVINPDILTDQKKGMGKIVTRVITMLLMLTAIIPLNIPNAVPGSYNAYLNQHGLLFGTMYSLQARILDQGTIEKLILGKVDSDDEKDTENMDAKSGIDKKKSANKMASYMLKAFVSINMKENATNDGYEDEDNYMCPTNDIDDDQEDVYDVYKQDDVSPMEILKYINTTCNYKDLGDKLSGQEGRYALAYFPIVPTICGGLVLYVLLGFCIDVAIRSLKLAILRLIAPIPIISYINPKSSENGSFANWVKLLISTFLNLFIILAIVFFTISIVSKMADKDQTVLSLPISDEFSVVNTIATVFIIVGVFFFARMAPKFIMDALGIKGMGLGVGLSGALGAAGALMGGGRLAGAAAGFLESADAASDAAAQGKQAPPVYSTQRDKIAKLQTGNKNAKGGLIGGLTRTANDYANQNMTRRLFGIDRNAVGRAKDEMYDLKTKASNAEETYKRFSTGHMTNTERVDIENGTAFNEYLASNGINDYAGQNADVQNRIMQQYLESDMSNKQTAAARQESWYKEGQQILEGFNINETVQEKYASTRTMRRRSDRLYNRDEAGYKAPADGHRGYADSHQYRGNENMNSRDRTRL